MTSTTPLTPPRAAETESIAGREVALRYGDVREEHAVLHRGAGLVDRSHRGRLRLTGPKAAEMLAGLVTNDVAALRPGQGLYAAALTPKGKIVADVRAFVEEEDILVDAPVRAADAWLAMVRKYVNPRLAPTRDESAALRQLGLYGPAARAAAVAALGGGDAALDAVAALDPYAHRAVEVDGARLVVARVPDLAPLEGFELFVPAEAFDAAWQRAVGGGARPVGHLAWEIARVEAARPEWGIDIDDNTIPQEANLDALQAISYTKGCYVGQEVVARLHFRGHVNKYLRAVRLEGETLPPPRTPLVDETEKSVGDVRSAVLSPERGAIGLAMVRREVPAGARLTARWEGGECPVAVDDVPYGAA